MIVNRRELLKKAGLAGLSVIGGSALYQLISGDRVLAELKNSPSKSTRWAMIIDMKKCARDPGCADCMDACHRAHNVPTIADPKREIKWIWKENFSHAFPELENEYIREDLKQQKFIVLCNHCDNPPCVRVCPTQATWKREDGIVMMDMHRCIGCRYCMAACPYGSRSFNWMDPRKALAEDQINPDFPTRTKGVVEKCDLCAERVDEGKIPVCVEACKEKALIFGNLSDPSSEVRKVLSGRFTIRRKPELGTRPEVYYLV
ncbi:MAG TPA: 4Fe-4S dicluster domain-containing protein [Spirochaetes bacterium]|nr:4Fe-4S dicluster domain-containing protein [Spirochaetota bacterium]